MAPTFDTLSDHDFELDEEDIDFSDLHAQYDVRKDEGLGTFVVIDGLPIVPEESKQKLVKFLLKKLNTVGRTSEKDVFMPLNDQNMSEGFAFVEYETPEQAVAATKQLHGIALDKKHTLAVNKITDIEQYGREGRIDEQYQPPEIEPFREKDHLRSWLGDDSGRDQFATYRGETVEVFWNRKKDPPEAVESHLKWAEGFIRWSPQGTYLASKHPKGVQLWGGPKFHEQKRFPHPFVNLFEFSPGEKYLTTWSNQPISVEEGMPVLSIEEDGKHIIIWDIATAKPLRSFVAHDLAPPPGLDGDAPAKKRVQWPAFKWSADEKYVARMKQHESLSIYETPRMNLLDRASVKIEGIVEFEWAPATPPKREGTKSYEQLLCFWTPEIKSNPAKVGLMSVPSKQIVRTRNLFNVSDVKLHWQSEAAFVCVKVDRHSKSKKSMATNLEIFRIREKGVPVEVVDSIKDTVIAFAWEPKGDRFVMITAAEVVPGSNVAAKTAVSFFCPEKVKGPSTGNFKLIRTVDRKNSNGIYWSPKGRFVVVGTLRVQQHFDLEFWDLDYEGEKPESEKDVSANLMLMNVQEHYGVTDVEWDPSGRYVVSGASFWMHQMENGYHMYTFAGELLSENPMEKFKQLSWRPRPPTVLSKEQQRTIRRNLRDYSRQFDEEDRNAADSANTAIVEERRRLLGEWLEWVEMERGELGIPEAEEALEQQRMQSAGEGEQVVEEYVEEVVEENEEFA